jgi:hypothetical protein
MSGAVGQRLVLLRGAIALEGDALAASRGPVDVLVCGDRIAAIEPAGTRWISRSICRTGCWRPA